MVSPRPPPQLLLQVPAWTGTPRVPDSGRTWWAGPLSSCPRPYFRLTPRGCDAGSQSWAQKDVSFHRCGIVFLSSSALSLSLIPSHFPPPHFALLSPPQRGLALREGWMQMEGGTPAHDALVKKQVQKWPGSEADHQPDTRAREEANTAVEHRRPCVGAAESLRGEERVRERRWKGGGWGPRASTQHPSARLLAL